MKAQIVKPQENGRWENGKEQVGAMAVVATSKGQFYQPITARFWMSRSADGAGPVYCSVWANNARVYLAGHGNARGFGYHKQSSALNVALRSAGVTLSESIEGIGETAMREALSALARALGFRKFYVVEL